MTEIMIKLYKIRKYVREYDILTLYIRLIVGK